ncbi:iron-sulfur cluster carrier protein ApbC [Roseateles sp. BYS180W]|uniref:Iron-sulfur cluster carrier protein n=1 Tax=Roseateles rivi TaxID=3299028 RepID=A0ABW7FVE6_9BURK
MSSSEAAVLQALQGVVDPNTGAPLIGGRALKQVQFKDGGVQIAVDLAYPAATEHEALRALVVQALQGLPEGGRVEVNFRTEVQAHAVQRGVALLPGVKNIIAVASGKGGVGKSTTAANLALALAADGARVGLLDADIYGPSVPTLMGVKGRPESLDGKTMEPLLAHGLQLMSIGFLVDEEQAMIWRGPMATSTLEQLLRQTRWQDLDYLIVDMPPGTGDIQLTLSQRVPVTGAVIVTTPQDIALADAKKGVTMFQKVGVPILGVVENMAVHVCSQCGHAEHIFGSGGAARLAQQFGAELLGELPLALAIREQADAGCPTVVAQPQSEHARRYRAIARRVAVKLAAQSKDYSSKFPTITISKNS